mmetsp:Transcript_19000/g.57702  ORF Transcript_19000/g.57702 Transcript_19000/m.57702 type:complete len:533 (-) Transcript_19000:27-1625(-)
MSLEAQADDAVLSTASSAATTKWSLISLGYLDDGVEGLWAACDRELGLSRRRGSALLRLLYYARVACLQRLRQRLLRRAGVSQVLILGAGLDPLGIRHVLEHGGALRVVEWDLPSNVAQKREICARCCPGRDLGNWSCEAVDLRRLDEVRKRLRGLDAQRPTLILAECCLSYLPKDAQDGLLHELCSYFQRHALLQFDPCGADTGFWAHTAKAFLDRGAGLHGCDGLAARLRQCYDAGFQHCRAWNLRAAAQGLVPESEWERISRIEPFDEYASLAATMRCYCIVLATNFDDDCLIEGDGEVVIPPDDGPQQRLERVKSAASVLLASTQVLLERRRDSDEQGVRVVEAAPEDLDSAKALVLEVYQPFAADKSVRRFLHRNIERELRSGGCFLGPKRGSSRLFVVKAGGVLAGCAGVVFRSPLKAELKHVAVSASWRRRGLARRLVRTVMDHCDAAFASAEGGDDDDELGAGAGERQPSEAPAAATGSEATARGCIYLSTLNGMQAAQKLYLSCGFTEVQRADAPYPQFQLNR